MIKSSFEHRLNIFLLLFSGLILFIAGHFDNFEYNLKKNYFFIHLSQLGLIINILFIGFSELAYFNLFPQHY